VDVHAQLLVQPVVDEHCEAAAAEGLDRLVRSPAEGAALFQHEQKTACISIMVLMNESTYKSFSNILNNVF
jgi:hypothetical protein